jgi:tetratricopeptide (TPR) repeat protein
MCALGVACSPQKDGDTSELKDPHFLRGQELCQQRHFKGAIESFEKAIEANPRSGAAHFELGILYQADNKGGDPTAAIYHFERFLRLRPNSPHADIVKQRIRDCKVEVARSENLVAATPATQRDFDRFKAEIERLAAENAQLRLKLEQAGHAAPVPPPAAMPTTPTKSQPPPATPPASEMVASTSPKSASSRSHTIRQGEYPATIAKQYRVKVDSLMAANPGIDPRRLKIGQVLTIPIE